MISRRRLLALAVAPLPAALAAGAAPVLARPQAFDPLPVDTAAVVGCVNSWRLDLAPLAWDEALSVEAAAWARHIADAGIRRPDGTFRHDPEHYGWECIAAGQVTWAEAINAWIVSPSHLPILRRGDAARVGMAGCVNRAGRPHWCLRVSA